MMNETLYISPRGGVPPLRVSALGTGAVLAAAALWGTVGPAQVLAGSSADPGALGVLRLLVGALVLAPFTLRGGMWRAVLVPGVRGWVLIAAAATGVYQVAFMHGVDRLGAALGTVVALGVAPVATGLAARWWTGDRIGAPWLVGTLAAVVGCVVLLEPWGSGGADLVGIGAALLSGACYGVYTVAAKRFLAAGAPATAATSVTLVAAGLVLSPIVLANPAHLAEPSAVALVVWLGVVATAAAYALFVFGLHRTTAPTAGTLSLAEPLVAAILGVVVLQERLTAAAVAGCGLLLVGLVVVTVGDARAGRTGRWSAGARRRSTFGRRPPRASR